MNEMEYEKASTYCLFIKVLSSLRICVYVYAHYMYITYYSYIGIHPVNKEWHIILGPNSGL